MNTINPSNTVSEVRAKWGPAIDAGFVLVPNVLLKHQAALGLNETDVVVLANLAMHWWFRDRLPFPRVASIAKRMGCGTRAVQRSLRRLTKELGLVSRVRQRASKGPAVRAYDLSGLQRKLANFAVNDPAYRAPVVVDQEVAMEAYLEEIPVNSLTG